MSQDNYIQRGKERIPYLRKADYSKIFNEDVIVSSKLDGALANIYLRNTGASFALSHRISKRTGQLIPYTNKIPEIKAAKLPTHLGVDKLDIKGEVLFQDAQGKILPHQEISGLLNSTEANIKQKLKERKLKPRIAIFDIWDDPRPYDQRLKTLEHIAKKNPSLFFTPETAHTKEEKLKLIDAIKSGNHPLTSEGIIINGAKKIKFTKPAEVYIKEFFQTKNPDGRYSNKAIGGFHYSHTPNGFIIGNVGTGFNDELRSDMFKNPGKYLGKKALIIHQ